METAKPRIRVSRVVMTSRAVARWHRRHRQHRTQLLKERSQETEKPSAALCLQGVRLLLGVRALFQPSAFATDWNVALALVPTARMAVKHTITINANITAYSTAVGPSSETRKRCTFKEELFISSPPTLCRENRLDRELRYDRDWSKRR